MTEGRSDHGWVTRRRWLAVSGSALAGVLAGCLGDDETDSDGDDGTGDNGSSDTGNSDGTDDTPDESGDDTDGDGGDSPDDDSLTVTIDGVTVDDTPQGEPLDILVDTAHPVTTALTNTDTTTSSLTLEVAIYPVGDQSDWPAPGDDDAIDTLLTDATPAVTTSDMLAIGPETTESVTFEALTPELAGGPYLVVARAADADTRAVTPLTVTATAEVPVEVYTQEVGPENRPASGQLTLTIDTDGVGVDRIERDVAALGETASPTVTLPLGVPADSATLTAHSVNDSVYPPASATVSLVRDPEPVTLVAGYPFQGTDSMRFSQYIHTFDAGRYPPYEEWIRYGVYGANGDFSSYYITGYIQEKNLWMDVDGSPPEYGADLETIANELGHVPPAFSVSIDGDAFYYSPVDEWWEGIDESSSKGRSTHMMVLNGLDAYTEPTPEERKFLRREQYRGRTVDVYRISGEIGPGTHPDSEVYVDPETGQVLRVERQPINNELNNSVEVGEFYDHGVPETADIEFMKEHSTDETAPGQVYLPWE
jgi:hypothetical protein